MLLDVRSCVGQPLAGRSSQGNLTTLRIINTVCNAIVVTEVELCFIAVQKLLGAVLIDAFHAALEDAVEALNGVRVTLGKAGAQLLIAAVVHPVMAAEIGLVARL